MPHGLTAIDITQRLIARSPTWVRPLSESGKSQKPMRVIGVDGTYARLEVIEGGRARQIRVALDKLRLSDPPEPPKPREKPAPPKPDPRPEPFTAVVPQPEPAPEPVEESKPMPTPNTYVVMEEQNKRFYTDGHKWTWDFDEARQYDNEGGANRAAGRLMGAGGRMKGKNLAVLKWSIARDLDAATKRQAELDKIAAEKPAPAPEPEVLPQPAPPPAPAPVAEAPAPSMPTPSSVLPPTMSPDMVTLQWALEAAMRAELDAYEVLQRRKIEHARVKHEIDLFITRKKNAFR